MDARKASETVLDYFQSVNKSGVGPIGASVESAKKEDSEWVVLATLWEYFGAPKRSRFRLVISPATAEVVSIERIGDAE